MLRLGQARAAGCWLTVVEYRFLSFSRTSARGGSESPFDIMKALWGRTIAAVTHNRVDLIRGEADLCHGDRIGGQLVTAGSA